MTDPRSWTLLSGPRARRFALVVAAAAGLLFVIIGLGREAWVDEPHDFDNAIHAWVVRERAERPALSRFFLAATQFGNPELAPFATILVAFGLYGLARRDLAGVRRSDALFWVAVILSSHYLSRGLKRIIRRERPPIDNRLVSESTFSFPSGHSVFSAVFFTMLAVFLVRMIPPSRPWLRAGAVFGCLASAVIVSASRIWLGVHYQTDVIGGLLLGAGWALSAWLVRIDWTREREAETREQAAAGPD